MLAGDHHHGHGGEEGQHQDKADGEQALRTTAAVGGFALAGFALQPRQHRVIGAQFGGKAGAIDGGEHGAGVGAGGKRHVGAFEGQVDAGVGDAGRALQHPFEAGRTGGAGHAANVEAARLGRGGERGGIVGHDRLHWAVGRQA